MAALLFGAGCCQAETARLRVQVEGVQNAEGDLRASLYAGPEGFRKEAQALRRLSVPARSGASSGETELVFDDLSPGRYAVMVYHDANADQQLNLRFGMFPLEGYGLSNNPKVMGPPKFEDSAVAVGEGDNRITVRLAY
jgi:uncharacterized protein (DUF2141 family)